MYRILSVFVITFFIGLNSNAQTSAQDIQNALQEKEALLQKSIVKNISFTNIGPTIMSGRVVDVDVNPNNVNEFYVAYASGGLWYTNNNGTTFTSVTDNAPTQNMGDIAVDWKNGTIWIGTGESNSSRSSYSGIGILKSTDKGKTWDNVGLTDSHHIGRIIINQNNPDEVVVGVIGHLYSSNKERGIFKTKDGGKTWSNTLFINENTGVIDISVSVNNANVLYAASWERDRKAWNFNGDGDGSAIYKSTDAGNTWTKLTEKGNGFPTGSGVGRIGLATFNDNVVYAFLDNQFRRPVEAASGSTNDGLQKDDFKSMSNGDFLALENRALNRYLRSNRFPRKYSAKSVKKSVKQGDVKPSDLATYLENANSLLFDSPVIGAEVYKSTNGGKTWKKTHKDYLDGVYSSYGYYFGIIAVNTSNENKIYIGGVPLLKSDDGGATFASMSKENVHSDHQSIWVNPKLEGHVINGNDGGINITYDDGENWIKNNQPSVGQFYYINVDNQKPYNVYGGLQDNGVWYGPSNYRASKSWNGSGAYPYKRIGGGDGMQVQIDSRDNNIVYGGSQFGFYYRVNLETQERLFINPRHELGDSPYRYNWMTPILLSPHNQDILYMGANKLLRSLDQGETFTVISEDLTTGGKKGNVPYGTLTTISESPFTFGKIVVGSDDGYINLTNDGGVNWTRISNGLPQNLWVSRVIASEHNKNRVYATLNGYRNDDFKAYVYVSENNGSTWTAITNNIPNSPVNVIKEDPSDENILYVGTDNGVYVSFNKGNSWESFSKGLTNAAVHDLVIQKEAKDLVVGTHGRSIYKADISGLQQFNTVKSNSVSIFDISSLRSSSFWGSIRNQYSQAFEPSVAINFYSNASGSMQIKILSEGGAELNTISVNADKGFNTAEYNLQLTEKGRKALLKENSKLRINKADNGNYYLPSGKYTVNIDGVSKFLKVE
ncbi:VPS10 domain-containing protein [Winogradskyella immobilis]|uniref:Glycosyl hydrolase n=1 Tax=Winogradskyella immobilis TaxID=2816852 RepID=A0ABS8EL59_9FLAO|nr:sialidase family protein [Winogradskyella immobilis]MCC1483305.1 glycosyl hydrolase [Winogradskyella immobilis]MCG0015399.1 glycosyl hydrolase [Winogradskyella immobilis]